MCCIPPSSFSLYLISDATENRVKSLLPYSLNLCEGFECALMECNIEIQLNQNKRTTAFPVSLEMPELIASSVVNCEMHPVLAMIPYSDDFLKGFIHYEPSNLTYRTITSKQLEKVDLLLRPIHKDDVIEMKRIMLHMFFRYKQ